MRTYLFSKMQNYLIKNEADSLEIKVYDDIGKGGFFWDEISAQMIIDQVEAVMPAKITLRINSGGGSVFEGLTIYNYLKSYKGNIKVIVDGLAASIASIIAMAGNRIEMGEGALMMIHDPLAGVMGNADEMRKMADVLDKVGGSLADIYVNKTGMPKDEILAMMKKETWLTAQEAVEMGFATKAKGVAVNNENLLKMVARYDAPKEVLNTLNNHKNMSDNSNQNWFEGFKNFLGLNKEMEEVKDQIVAPVKNELEAKLKAEQEAKAAIEAQLAEAQNKAQQLEELQAKLTAMEEQIKNAGKPIEAPSDDHASEHEEVQEMSELEKMENSLRAMLPTAKINDLDTVIARAKRVKEIENRVKNKQ